mgnify:CR=1 FL=1
MSFPFFMFDFGIKGNNLMLTKEKIKLNNINVNILTIMLI